MDLKDEILRRVEMLPFEQQRQVLAYCESFEDVPYKGEHGTALLSFFGTLDDISAKEMLEAIDAACETVDAREW